MALLKPDVFFPDLLNHRQRKISVVCLFRPYSVDLKSGGFVWSIWCKCISGYRHVCMYDKCGTVSRLRAGASFKIIFIKKRKEKMATPCHVVF